MRSIERNCCIAIAIAIAFGQLPPFRVTDVMQAGAAGSTSAWLEALPPTLTSLDCFHVTESCCCCLVPFACFDLAVTGTRWHSLFTTIHCSVIQSTPPSSLASLPWLEQLWGNCFGAISYFHFFFFLCLFTLHFRANLNKKLG